MRLFHIQEKRKPLLLDVLEVLVVLQVITPITGPDELIFESSSAEEHVAADSAVENLSSLFLRRIF